MKKNKVKKLVSKMLGQELGTYDSRLNDLEINAGIKFFEIRPDTFTKGFCGEMAVKDAEHITVVSKTEITELPDKWCVEVTEENHMILTDWKIKISDGEFNSTAKGYKFIRNNGEGFTEKEDNFIIIPFSDFERLVLKKEQIGNSEELATGWFKNDFRNLLFYPTGEFDKGKDPIGYGFVEDKWNHSKIIGWSDVTTPATKEEVEAALKAKAAKLGYKEGQVIHSPNAAYNATLKNLHELIYRQSDNALVYMYNDVHGIPIMVNGKWAEIISQPEENIQEVDFEIDFSKPGLILISNIGTVMTSGVEIGNTFSGTLLETCHADLKAGGHSDSWSKKRFQLHSGKLKLSN